MPYENSWLLKNRIARMRLYSEITPDEIVIGCTRLRYDFLDKSINPVHLLIIAENLKSAPHDFSALQNAFQVLFRQKNAGWMIVIGLHHPLMRFIAMTISRSQDRFKGVATLDAALVHLYQVDPELPMISTAVE
ncbi:MAG: hypothetical protein ACPG7F_03265 [Aggregatilineales bacterium]